MEFQPPYAEFHVDFGDVEEMEAVVLLHDNVAFDVNLQVFCKNTVVKCINHALTSSRKFKF